MLTIAQSLKNEMIAQDRELAWAGDPDLLLTAYMNTNGKVQHPLNKIKAVIDAARKSKLFVHDGYIRSHDCSGRRQILYPVFKIKH